MWYTYASIKLTLEGTNENMLLNEMIRNESAFLSYSIISTVFTVRYFKMENHPMKEIQQFSKANDYFFQVLLVLIVLYLRNRVTVVVQLFREAGSALLAMPCLVIQPFLTYLSLTGFFCVWLYIVLCLATAGKFTLLRILENN